MFVTTPTRGGAGNEKVRSYQHTHKPQGWFTEGHLDALRRRTLDFGSTQLELFSWRSWIFRGRSRERRPRHQQKRHALILLRHKTRNVQRGAACGACYYALAPLAGRGQCMNLNKLGRVRGKGKPPHPFFVVALPNSLSPQAGRGHNNDRLISCDAVRLKRNRRASQNLTTPRHPGLPKRGILGVAKRRDDTLRLDAVDQRKIVRRARMHVPALKQRAAGFHKPPPGRP
jgi:hypothetical protein